MQNGFVGRDSRRAKATFEFVLSNSGGKKIADLISQNKSEKDDRPKFFEENRVLKTIRLLD